MANTKNKSDYLCYIVLTTLSLDSAALCKDISHLELLLTSSNIIDDKRDVHQNSSIYNNSKKATYNLHLLMHFVIAIMLRCFVVVDVDNARYLTSELEKINVEER